MKSSSYDTPARNYAPGIGDAVADRTINRKINRMYETAETRRIKIPRRDDISLDHEIDEWCKSEGLIHDGYHVVYGDDLIVVIDLIVTGECDVEKWADVAKRVAIGNAMLCPTSDGDDSHYETEFEAMHHHLRQASILMSGRHLQHGDETQPTRPLEVFTNCLDGRTEILTQEYGPIALSAIVGEVVTVKAADGQWRQAVINEHGEQELFEINFRSVTSGGGKFRRAVRATANHRWFLRDGSVTESLSVGDVIRSAPSDVGVDSDGVVHGIVFGDGSAHKSRNDNYRSGVSQGRTYAAIRVCAQDSVKEEIHEWLDSSNYKYTTPTHADGDRVYYLGKKPHIKELPHTRDPEYIAGFIHGWWLADGYKAYGSGLEISTANEDAASWLLNHAAYGGFSVTAHRVMERKEGDGSFANGKALHVIRLRKNVEWKVDSIESVGFEVVYCPEEPVTSGFVLANGLLTGNCSSSATTFLTFYLLLNGSGVGRSYDDAMMLVDWNKMPLVVPVIDSSHDDAQSGEIVALDNRTARHLYAGRTIRQYKVPDSREGWAKAIEKMELLTYQGAHRNDVLLLDFSDVRPRGAPIAGMQDRPASGPGPLMDAIRNIAQLRDAGMEPWRAAMYADHYSAECVLVGGARRAARMSAKTWRDASVFDFIDVKRGGFLWSSNNSVTVDNEFWRLVKLEGPPEGQEDLWTHAKNVLGAITKAAYYDQTGEPGIINQEALTQKDDKIETLLDGNFAKSARYQLEDETLALTSELAKVVASLPFKMITNPCGEITLLTLGGYCVIADVVPFHAGGKMAAKYQSGMKYPGLTAAEMKHHWDVDAEDAFRTATRALMRTNLMDSLYSKEVKRTNRIGVGMTGFHEYAWARFSYGFRDIIDEDKSQDFWQLIGRFKRAVVSEAESYAQVLGVEVPHTNTTFKPAGTTSKLFGLTEGAHLPSMKEYVRWVQFRNDDPLIDTYREKGYPVRKLRTYSGTTIVGFPTQPTICTLGMGDKLVTAADATPEEQYQFLRLIEKYWIRGVEEDDITPLEESGNQVSYTLKYNPEVVSYEEFVRTLIEGQSTIRCCSVMPQSDTSAYEYQPEEQVTKHDYELICASITSDDEIKEDVGKEHVDCAGGACPISFNENSAAKVA